MSRKKERASKNVGEVAIRKVKIEYSSPFEGELTEDGKFLFSTFAHSFKGEPMPSHFKFKVSEDDELEEGQIIGTSRSGQVLYWEQGMVIAKG